MSNLFFFLHVSGGTNNPQGPQAI